LLLLDTHHNRKKEYDDIVDVVECLHVTTIAMCSHMLFNFVVDQHHINSASMLSTRVEINYRDTVLALHL
jgi:radical SAM superfamily enzyme